MINKKEFQVNCKDGVTIKGILLIPDNPKAVIQFNCGTAVKKEVYLSFLTYIAENGYLCCLWNYRDSENSAQLNLSNCRYKYSDYGQKDMPAIKNFLNDKYPDLPFFFVAHSTGGQQIGLMNNLKGVKGAINIAVSTGYFPNMPLGYRLKAYFFFYFFAPISISLIGYVASSKLQLMEDLPKGILLEWRDWCSKKDYFFDENFYGKTIPEGSYKDIDFPIKVFYSPDDTISGEANTNSFWRNVKSTKDISITKISIDELPLKKIDHFDYFRKPLKDTFWATVLAELNKMLAK